MLARDGWQTLFEKKSTIFWSILFEKIRYLFELNRSFFDRTLVTKHQESCVQVASVGGKAVNRIRGRGGGWFVATNKVLFTYVFLMYHYCNKLKVVFCLH